MKETERQLKGIAVYRKDWERLQMFKSKAMLITHSKINPPAIYEAVISEGIRTIEKNGFIVFNKVCPDVVFSDKDVRGGL